MVRFTQELLRPGDYRLAHGRTGRLTREDLAQVAAATQSLLQNGYEIPVLSRHAPRGAPEGGPQRPGADSPTHPEAKRVGRLAAIEQRDDGSLHQILEIEDDASAQALSSGSLRHTSAELRPRWTDEEGREYGPIVAHVALTSSPRHVDQPPAELLHGENAEPVQFSLDEIEGLPSLAATAAAKSALDAAPIPAALRHRLWLALTSRQFSLPADEPTLPLRDVLHLFESTLPTQLRAVETAHAAPHSAGETFFTGEALSEEQAEQIARAQIQRAGLDR